jgi:hypothetical protein
VTCIIAQKKKKKKKKKDKNGDSDWVSGSCKKDLS